jgi:hypothetical protein
MELLRRMAVNDARLGEDCLGGGSVDFPGLDANTLELVRLAALVAVGVLCRPMEPRPMPR